MTSTYCGYGYRYDGSHGTSTYSSYLYDGVGGDVRVSVYCGYVGDIVLHGGGYQEQVL